MRRQHCIACVSTEPGEENITTRKVRATVCRSKTMENKSILIVEDNQMSVQLVSVLLANEGYDLRSASTADEALNVLTTFQPALILMDIQLPGKSGLELTRQLRANRSMNDTKIVALTGYGREGDDQACLKAGCDGYIAKPINTATFPAIVRAFMDDRHSAVTKSQGDVRDLLRDLRNQFITEALAELTELLSPDTQVDKNHLLRALHRCAGVAGTLGMQSVTDQARKVEVAVEAAEEANDTAVREGLEELKRLIGAAAAGPAFELAMPAEILKTLSGKRFGLACFSEAEADRIAQALHRADCFSLSIQTPPEGLSKATVERFDMVILNLNGTANSTCQHNPGPAVDKPVLLVGSRERLTDDLISIDTPARDFLMTPWDSEELLVRCCKLLSENSRKTVVPQRKGPAQVVIADDDPAIGALLSAVLRRTGAECRLARNGKEALALVREVLPDVVILDVNMPGIDGFEVLTNLRADDLAARIPVVLLSARQQEVDILKGFSCGASDYITKPFNPMEVTARIGRYLPRKTIAQAQTL
jgi:two-component system cell cycle response regulator DivK